MKLHITLASLVMVLGLNAQADDLKLTMYSTAPGVAVTDCETVAKVQKRGIVGRSGEKLTYINVSWAIEGSCRRDIDPGEQTYLVNEKSNSCGSVMYKAKNIHNEEEKLSLLDHSKRYCMDIVPARYIMTRSSPRARYMPMYASRLDGVDRPRPPYHPGPVQVIPSTSYGLVQALLENPEIGEMMRHSNNTRIVKASMQAMAPGIVVYVFEAVSMTMVPGKAIVTIEANSRNLRHDGRIKYKIDYEILE